jgi:hypothetical protein
VWLNRERFPSISFPNAAFTSSSEVIVAMKIGHFRSLGPPSLSSSSSVLDRFLDELRVSVRELSDFALRALSSLP